MWKNITMSSCKKQIPASEVTFPAVDGTDRHLTAAKTARKDGRLHFV